MTKYPGFQIIDTAEDYPEWCLRKNNLYSDDVLQRT